MSNSICKFMPPEEEIYDIKTVNFVYEAEFTTLKQPFFRTVYILNIVTNGTAVLKLQSKEYALKKNDAFFAFPAYPYTIEGSADFEYIYISFTGEGAAQILNKRGISAISPVRKNMGEVLSLWQQAIRRTNPENANLLTNGILLYTLSLLESGEMQDEQAEKESFDEIINYINAHCGDYDMSLKKIAWMYSYNSKYLSYLFKKNMGIGFSKYLNNLRIQYAVRIVEDGETSINAIADKCGYNPFYFSKIFKKQIGLSPTEYIKMLSLSSK